MHIVAEAALRLFDHARNEYTVASKRSAFVECFPTTGFREVIRRIYVDTGQIATDDVSSGPNLRHYKGAICIFLIILLRD